METDIYIWIHHTLPLQTINDDGTATQIEKRLHLFRTGNIKKLYYDSRKVVSRTPLDKATRHKNELKTTRNRCAQLAADNDNYRSAIERLTTETPIALNTPETVEILKSLYPPKHIIIDNYLDTSPKKFKSKHKPLTLKSFIKIFSRLPKEKPQDH